MDAESINAAAFAVARRKYLKLGREIEELPGGVARDNLIHTHSKLGLFLEGAVGREAWRASDTDEGTEERCPRCGRATR